MTRTTGHTRPHDPDRAPRQSRVIEATTLALPPQRLDH